MSSESTESILVKICGITSVEDALMVAEAGADLVGLIFAPSSRRVDEDTARRIARALPSHVGTVGVFVDGEAEEINRLVSAVGLSQVQLAGTASRAMARSLGAPVIRALGVHPDRLPEVEEWPEGSTLLLDTWNEGGGGSGRPWPWYLAIGLRDRYRLFVSGGLAADNVGSAIGALRPHGVDASSRLESSPGIKDPREVRRFVAAVRRLERFEELDPRAGEETSTQDYIR